MNWSEELVGLVPPRVTTVMATMPVRGGDTTEIFFVDITVNFAVELDPKIDRGHSGEVGADDRHGRPPGRLAMPGPDGRHCGCIVEVVGSEPSDWHPPLTGRSRPPAPFPPVQTR